ncbi:MAG: amidohydrolase family protein [Acidobacteriota bacterium]
MRSIGRRQFIGTGLGFLFSSVTSENQAVPLAGQTGTSPPSKPKHRIIDVHCHPNWIGHNGERIIQDMDRCGIERAWLLSWEIPERELDTGYYATLNPTAVGIPFSDVVSLCVRYPGRFVPATTMDPRDPQAHAKLKAAADIHGVRVFGEFKLRMRYDDPDAIRLFHYCGELGLPVILHLDVTFPRHGVPSSRQWWYGGGIEVLEAPLRLCPRTQFLGHAPGFWREISGDADQAAEAYPKGKPIVGKGKLVEFLDRYPNLNCDLSAGSGYTALTRDLKFTRQFLIDYQDRVFFGRDEFSTRLYELLLSLDLPQPVLTKILAGNALRLVPL